MTKKLCVKISIKKRPKQNLGGCWQGDLIDETRGQLKIWKVIKDQ
jgi:hypothetical protein